MADEESDVEGIVGSGEDAGADRFARAHGDTGDEQILEEIGQAIEKLDLGFDFKVLDVLDDERARPAEIEALKDKLGEVVAARLFSVANSNYYGKLRSGKLTRFVDVVTHLGTDTTKSMALFIALMALADSDDLKAVFARNYATSRIAELLAVKLGLSGSERSTVALGGLFVEIGKVIISLYSRESERKVTPEFVGRHYSEVGAQVIEKFELPLVLGTLVRHPYFAFVKKDSLSLPAVLDFAHALVEQSFARHGKLVVESIMPDPEGLLYSRTAGSVLAGQFQSIGLSAYLHVVHSELSEQEKRLYEKRAQESGGH